MASTEEEGRPPPFGGVDPFRDIRGDGPGGDLLGPASLGLCCAVCCVCTLVSLLIAYLVWAISTVVYSKESTESDCGAMANIWLFCLIVVIMMPLLGCITSIISYFTVRGGGGAYRIHVHSNATPPRTQQWKPAHTPHTDA